MAEVVQLQRQHADPYALLSGAVRQYEDALQQQRDERSRGQQLDLQRGQLDLGNRELTSNDSYRKGQLQQGQDTLDFQKNVESAKNTLALWQKRMDEGDPTVQTEAAQYVQDHPEQAQYLAAAAHFHASLGQQAKGVAEQKHVADNTAVAAGSTDPNANAIYTHDVTSAFPTPQMFTQQQATDLGARAATKGGAPNLKANVPKPSGNAVGDFEARSVGALTDASQNQTSQTQITTEGMRQRGETQRQSMVIKAQKDAAAATGAGLPDIGAGGDISKEKPLVRLLVSRDADPAILTGLMRRKGGEAAMNEILGRVLQYDPKFNAGDYAEQFAIKKSYNAGKDKPNVDALNTAIGHLHDLWVASGKIDNFDSLPLVNTLVNKGKNMAKVASGGGQAVLEYRQAMQGVSGEFAKLYKGGIGTEGEIEEWKKTANESHSDPQRRAEIQHLAHMAGARYQPLAATYERTGRSFYDDKITPQNKKRMQDMGLDPMTFDIVGKGQAPATGVAGAPTTPRAFGMTATSPNGHKIGSDDGNTWYDVQTGQRVQ